MWLLVANFAGKRRLRGGVKPDQHTVVKINYLIQFPPLWYLMRINEANKISDICNISIRFPISDKTMIFAGFYMDCNISCLVSYLLQSLRRDELVFWGIKVGYFITKCVNQFLLIDHREFQGCQRVVLQIQTDFYNSQFYLARRFTWNNKIWPM